MCLKSYIKDTKLNLYNLPSLKFLWIHQGVKLVLEEKDENATKYNDQIERYNDQIERYNDQIERYKLLDNTKIHEVEIYIKNMYLLQLKYIYADSDNQIADLLLTQEMLKYITLHSLSIKDELTLSKIETAEALKSINILYGCESRKGFDIFLP